jgi:site-specific recombinase XerD
VRRVATPYYLARDFAIVSTFLGTGVRLSELVGLTLTNIEVQSAQASIRVRGKGNKERIIPLNVEVAESLRKYLTTRPEVPTRNLFVSRLGNALGTGSVYHLIKRYLKEAGIKKEKVGVHSLRHTFGASLLNSGANLVVIQELLGHRKLETTRRYLHINNVDLRNAVDRLVLTKQP